MKLGSYNYGTHEATNTHGVVLGTFKDHAEARAAMYAARLPVDFWFDVKLPAIPLLHELNNWVIKQNENRLPKWKFRFSPDFAVMIQPRITCAYAILFEGVALQIEDGVSVKFFTEPKQLCSHRYWRMGFRLSRKENDTAWSFKPKSADRGRGCPSSGLIELRSSVIAALHVDHFTALRPDLMLSPQCLCCGKGLTDPVSMARWIGPECWGSASTNIPRIFKAEVPEPMNEGTS